MPKSDDTNITQLSLVEFHGERLIAFERDGVVLVAVRPIVAGMGLEWSAQWRRIQRDPNLAEAVAMMATPFGRHGQEETCLPLELMHGWLFTVDSARVKPGIRERVLLYQRECYRVLFSHFSGAALPDVGRVSAEEQDRLVRMVTEARHTNGRRFASRLWFAFGLPGDPSWIGPRQPDLFEDSPEPGGNVITLPAPKE